jgi:lysophospholipase L1-like esterase
MEIALQVASLVLPAMLVRSECEYAEANALTILCVGDSHTFGAPLPAQDAYPAQLSERMNALRTERRVRVVNLGIPGQNSAMVANRLEKQINYYRPDLVIVWVD